MDLDTYRNNWCTRAVSLPPPQPDQYLWSCPPAYLFPSPGKWFSLSAVTIMSHRVVIIVIADGPDNLPAVICTIEEYFHFSLFLPLLSFSPLVLIAAAPISTHRLVCSRGERDLSSMCNILSASRGETQLHHLPLPSSHLILSLSPHVTLPLPPSFFPLRLSHRSLLPVPSPKLFTLRLTFPLSFSVSPFISQKASPISWHDTACHQHCLPLAFDRGISSPLLFLSLFSFVFSLLYFCPPPSSRKLSFVAHCLGGI